ncbi:FdhF/YdeP family oxidoreductase [Simiduia curdlanivorans]|uniref:FdhF/YdeP family oxidoreductase n=1 Tax=Simiduia curdlanivorans TaxID=1492769 RepID=A0ABV8UZ20_9GAMM|nr:FdhF/YdeP family oxidoreductase [Simiduia curdlanivorans]MDN3639167.1 FdhF/YdeP family oxidoreductase [Simiduia curdlanivorans]
MNKDSKKIVGGGFNKVLYTLQTANRIGLRASAKALTAKNACKACGLGMGGQRGGMTNELDEFPSVCNKSVQAQSTDIQNPIPLEIFNHNLKELQELDGYEVEHLGRLDTPLFKAKDAQYFKPISWGDALAIASARFNAARPDKTFFYASGRSSNEAGFLLQLFARAYGTNNINNCSYFCHQATGVALQNAIGSGTATVALEDLADCDFVLLSGANPASNHPRLLHSLKKCRDRGGKVIVINPAEEPGLVRFALPKSPSSLIAGGHEIASVYLQPKAGADAYLFLGVGKAVLEGQKQDSEFIESHTHHYLDYLAQIESTSWLTIEMETGLTREAISNLAAIYSQAKRAIFAWGMGLTHHKQGVENIEHLVNVALLRGMIGKPGAGLLPLRGHSNVQGMGSIGMKPVLPSEVIEKFDQQLGILSPKTPGMDTMACLEAAFQNTIEAALFLGGNILEAAPDTRWASQALDNIHFKLFLTTTLNRGHLHGTDKSESLILPVTARDEEHQPTTQESMFNYVRLSDGGITRFTNVKPEVEIIGSLASAVIDSKVFDFSAFRSHTTLRQAIAKTIKGLEALATIDQTKQEFHIPQRRLNHPHFQTESGKASFLASPLQPHKINSEFPFNLISARSEGQFNTIIYEQKDTYRGATHRQTVFMHQQDLLKLGLKDNAWVDIISPHGEVNGLQVKIFNITPGSVLGYYPELNVLIGRELDPRSRTPAYKSAAVQVIATRTART